MNEIGNSRWLAIGIGFGERTARAECDKISIVPARFGSACPNIRMTPSSQKRINSRIIILLINIPGFVTIVRKVAEGKKPFIRPVNTAVDLFCRVGTRFAADGVVLKNSQGLKYAVVQFGIIGQVSARVTVNKCYARGGLGEIII